MLRYCATVVQTSGRQVCLRESQDGAEPASHKKSSSPLVVHLDEDWIAEYALQVTRMLPGGGVSLAHS